jgi:hypothetical protein
VSVHVAFDIYPAATPNGTLLVRLLASGTGTKQAVELSARKVLHGSGEGMIRIHSSHAAATSANFTKRNYVKVVLVNGATETEWFGFFLEQGDFGAISRREQAGRMLTFSGPGSLFYLDRALLLAEIYAPGQPRRGNLELDGQWGWNDIPYGAIMTRAMEEGYYEPGNPLFYATWDFTRTVDSASVAWPNIDNEFTVPWGTSIYDLIASFIKLGLVVTVDADLTFHAWQTYGTNRTSATFAAGKIRFAHGVNIGNEVTRQIRASLERSHIFVVGDEFTSAVVSGGSSAVTYYDTLQKQETNDSATLTAAGTRDLTQREIQADAAFPVRVILDDDELNGKYVPGEHYDVGDIATIHTVPPSGASGEHDFTNFAIEVAAIKVEHDDAGNWFAVNELGAQYLSAQLSAMEVPSSKIIHQIELCRATAVGAPTIESYGFVETGTSPRAIIVPAGLTDSILVVFGAWDKDNLPFVATYGAATLTAIPGSSIAGGSDSGMQAFYQLNPAADPTGAGDQLQVVDSTAAGGWKGYFVLSGVNQSAPFGTVATASGTGTTSALTIGGAGAYLNAAFAASLSGGSGATAPTPVAGQTQAWTEGFGAFLEFGGGFGDSTPAWTFGESRPWVALGVAVQGDVRAGDGHAALIGTSIRAKRCDDTEHYHTTADPTVNDDASLGFRNGTLWINETTGAMFLLLDNTDGAADWLSVGGAGVDLTGINFLVGTATGLLSAEIAVGTTPGGELGGTWASPTVDATHSGSTHDAATNTHIADATDAHDASAISFSPAGSIAATDVQAAIEEVASEAGGSFTLTVEEEGTPLATGATTLDFVGAGVTATGAGAEKTITIPGGSGITVEDEGSALSTAATTLDFVGAGVTASGTGAEKTITIPGASSSSPFGIDNETLDATTGDHFDGTSLDAKWTRHNIGANTELFENSHLRVDIQSGTADQHYRQTIVSNDEIDLVMDLSRYDAPATDIMTGPFLADASGTGLAIGFRSTDVLEMSGLSSWVATSSPVTIAVSGGTDDLTRLGKKHWLHLTKRGGRYFMRYSLDGNTWSRWSLLRTDSLAPVRAGFGRYFGNGASVASGLAVGRFDLKRYSRSANRVITPSSGTATYTASSAVGGWEAQYAANGSYTNGAGNAWAANGTGDAPTYWQVAWSVAQSINRVDLFCRDSLGHGYLEFSDGSKVGIPQAMTDLVAMPISFATKSTTLLKVVSTGDKAGNPGLTEVEAYLATLA